MNTPPKMGRPSVTGLSVKALGEGEYRRRYHQMKPTPRITARRWWTGLPAKLMSRAEYMAAWRALRARARVPERVLIVYGSHCTIRQNKTRLRLSRRVLMGRQILPVWPLRKEVLALELGHKEFALADAPLEYAPSEVVLELTFGGLVERREIGQRAHGLHLVRRQGRVGFHCGPFSVSRFSIQHAIQRKCHPVSALPHNWPGEPQGQARSGIGGGAGVGVGAGSIPTGAIFF